MIEIERKFIVRSDGWQQSARSGESLRQGYLVSDAARSARVRIAGERAYLTVKGGAGLGGVAIARLEFEYVIPQGDAALMLESLCDPAQIQKTRWSLGDLDQAGTDWIVDVFEGANAPLILAEVELARADLALKIPSWCGAEVSEDLRFTNSALAKRPYGDWPVAERPRP